VARGAPVATEVRIRRDAGARKPAHPRERAVDAVRFRVARLLHRVLRDAQEDVQLRARAERAPGAAHHHRAGRDQLAPEPHRPLALVAVLVTPRPEAAGEVLQLVLRGHSERAVELMREPRGPARGLARADLRGGVGIEIGRPDRRDRGRAPAPGEAALATVPRSASASTIAADSVPKTYRSA
jgi:hypothetical protein